MKNTKLFLSLALAACVATLSLSRCTTHDDGFAPKTDAPKSGTEILAEYVSLDDMQYSLDITEAEAEALGVSHEVYGHYASALEFINADVQKTLAENPDAIIHMQDPDDLGNDLAASAPAPLLKSRTEDIFGSFTTSGTIWNQGGSILLNVYISHDGYTGGSTSGHAGKVEITMGGSSIFSYSYSSAMYLTTTSPSMPSEHGWVTLSAKYEKFTKVPLNPCPCDGIKVKCSGCKYDRNGRFDSCSDCEHARYEDKWVDASGHVDWTGASHWKTDPEN